jgi:rod shape-determining protein MreC
MEGNQVKALFLKETTLGYQILGLGVLSLVLIFMDHTTSWLDSFRSALTSVLMPIIVTADLPNRSALGIQDIFSSREDLHGRISGLESELIFFRVKSEKMAALASENDRLRSLLGSAAKLQDNVLVAELIGVNPDPEQQEVLIDKGFEDSVFVGQPVLDSRGLVGQVVAVSSYSSRVLLISDQRHSVPVQVLRNNLRLVAQGTGIGQRLELLHVNSTADIQVGDQLLSSGLGNRFPVGYPVGVVDKVDLKLGMPFSEVLAKPNAQLDRSSHVLLVFTEVRVSEDTDGSSAKSENRGG